MSSPQVVVACAWYNRADYIRQTVDSLLNQDFDSFEIVIVNDGSTDPRVKEILDSYDDPRLRVIHQENTGFTVAIRRAIDASEAPYIAIQGAGDISYPERLRKQWEYLTRNSHVGTVGSGHDLASAVSRRTIGYVAPTTELKAASALKQKVPFTHGTAMHRRSVYEQAGGYDTFFVISQDRELYWRIMRVSNINAIDKSLYCKFIFNDGVTFDPSFIAYQNFFGKLAKSGDQTKINYFKENNHYIPNKNDIFRVSFFPYTFKRIISLIIRREFTVAFYWIKVLLIQFKIITPPSE